MDAPIDKDLPLKEDTRLLGRVLGDVLRAQTGEGGFACIEAIRQMAIRFRGALTPRESAEFDAALYRQVLGLWQTAMLRLSKLQVRDEIDNGLAYYRYTFLDQIPKLYADLCEHLARDFGIDGETIPPFLRTGSWIGGDRDGNPNVDAETLSYAIRAQAGVAFEHYLAEVHRLGGELSLSSRLIAPTEALLALAARAHDENPHRKDEPYRNALIGIYARLAATSNTLAGYVPPRAPSVVAEPYATAAEFRADLDTIAVSLATHGATPLAARRLDPLRRATDVFGFHLAVLDLRQHSDVHEQVIDELLSRARVTDG